MRINDLATLKAAVSKFAQQDLIAEDFELVLQLAEARMTNDIKSRRIEASVHGTLSDPVIPIPVDIAIPQRLMLYLSGTREYTLDYYPPAANEQSTAAGGRPRSFTMIDQTIIVYPTPSRDYEYTLYYIPQIRPLTTGNPTNDILTRAPNVYMYACLADGHTMIKDHPQAAMYMSLYNTAWQSYQSSENATKYPKNTPLRVQMRSAV